MSSGKNSDERNPFAPPPEDAPDQPWRPRAPQGPGSGGEQPDGGTGGEPDDRPQLPPPHPWSPNWQGSGGPGWPERPQAPQQPRFDPNDPAHRRSRYALSSGMAALGSGFYLGIQELALLFGTLAVYWGISALRAAAAPAEDAATPVTAAAPATPQAAPVGWPYAQRSRPQLPAALGGLITGGVTLALVLASFGLTVAFRPYYTCLDDALTTRAEQSCSTLAPHWLVSITQPGN